MAGGCVSSITVETLLWDILLRGNNTLSLFKVFVSATSIKEGVHLSYCSVKEKLGLSVTGFTRLPLISYGTVQYITNT